MSLREKVKKLLDIGKEPEITVQKYFVQNMESPETWKKMRPDEKMVKTIKIVHKDKETGETILEVNYFFVDYFISSIMLNVGYEMTSDYFKKAKIIKNMAVSINGTESAVRGNVPGKLYDNLIKSMISSKEKPEMVKIRVSPYKYGAKRAVRKMTDIEKEDYIEEIYLYGYGATPDEAVYNTDVLLGYFTGKLKNTVGQKP